MILKAEIRVDKPALYECFKPEEMKYDRGCFTVKKQKDHLIFNIQAKDAVALRTILNAICRLLEVQEKAGKIK